MYRKALLTLALLIGAAGTSSAGLLFSTNPTDGVLTGAPGQTVGWGVTFTADDSSYYALTQVAFCIGAQVEPCSDTAAGTFTDIAAGISGIIIGANYSPSPYTELFSAGTSGLGQFTIDLGAVSQTLSGTFYVHYDVFDGDPADSENTVQLLANQIITGQGTVNIDAEPVAEAPEPTTMMLTGFSLLGAIVLRRSRR